MENSKDFSELLGNIIEQKIQKVVKEEMNKSGNMRGFAAKVSSVNGNGTVNVILAGETTIIPNLKNKTNQTLVANDEVFLFSISNLSNAFVGIKK